MKDRLINLLQENASNEGTSMQSSLRDVLTDLRHIAEIYALDFDLAVDGSDEVFEEESAK